MNGLVSLPVSACGISVGPAGKRLRADVGWWGLLAVLWLAVFSGISPACAEETGKPASGPAGKIFIPQLIDPERRIERRPDARIQMIRFVTEEDFPPFNYIGRDGNLAGFNVDLARQICAELGAHCTIQARRWDLLLPALEKNGADAVIASHRITADLKREYEVSLPTHRSPARFVARKDRTPVSVTVGDLAGKRVGVVGGSSHEAYLNAFFPALQLKRFEKPDQALEAMRRGETDLAFGDGVTAAFWMNGSDSLDCCAFAGGAFTEAFFFGEGAGIVMKLGNSDLRNAVDFALWRINRDGRYARLYLKHFPIPFY
jgi:polar amino acid transport system substrate-binding protein